MSTTHVAKLAALAASLVFAVACGEPRGRLGDGRPPETVSLTGRVLTDTLALGDPTAILPWRDLIFVLDSKGDSAVLGFDTLGNLVAAAGRRGNGPGEFAWPKDLFRDASDPDLAWVFDSRSRRLTPVRLPALAGGEGKNAFGDPIVLSGLLAMYPPIWLDDSTLVVEGGMLTPDRKRFALVDPAGKLVRTVGDHLPGNTNEPPFVRQQVFGGSMAAHPRRPMFVLAGRYAPLLEVFDREGARVLAMEVPVTFEPDVSVAPDGLNFVRGRDSGYAYLDVDATADRVYALFSGRSSQEYRKTMHLGEYVHVFDWTGRLIAILRLDAEAFSLAVDESESRLYVGRVDPYPQIAAYDLRSIRSILALGERSP